MMVQAESVTAIQQDTVSANCSRQNNFAVIMMIMVDLARVAFSLPVSVHV